MRGPMNLARGMEITGQVVQCARNLFERHGSFPATEAELAKADCPDARLFARRRRTSMGATACRGRVRAMTPVWRTTYAATASGFVLDVTPASELQYEWPRVHATSDGRVSVTTGPGAAAFENLRPSLNCASSRSA
jgi:hypothetical protein